MAHTLYFKLTVFTLIFAVLLTKQLIFVLLPYYVDTVIGRY